MNYIQTDFPFGLQLTNNDTGDLLILKAWPDVGLFLSSSYNLTHILNLCASTCSLLHLRYAYSGSSASGWLLYPPSSPSSLRPEVPPRPPPPASYWSFSFLLHWSQWCIFTQWILHNSFIFGRVSCGLVALRAFCPSSKLLGLQNVKLEKKHGSPIIDRAGTFRASGVAPEPLCLRFLLLGEGREDTVAN